jgi:hypothetical protein
MGGDEVASSDVAEGWGKERRKGAKGIDPVSRPWVSGWDKSPIITRYFDL